VKAAVIAAGHGERLSALGDVQKPLVRVGGVTLIDRVLSAIAAAGIEEVACIFNREADAVEEHCRIAGHRLRMTIVRRTTPSSMESLFALAPHLGEDRFVLLTVDSIFPPGLLPDFLAAAERASEADAVLATTSFVDDEKPLRITVDDRGRATAIGAAAAHSPLVTAGLYVFRPTVFAEIDAARRKGLSALRQWLSHLLDTGYDLRGTAVGKTVDVDRPRDIAVAEEFIRSGYGSSYGSS
jgi:NDP-sugar pyrophosphorylase family protein